MSDEVTNEEYIEMVAKIAARDKQSLEDAVEVVNSLADDLASAMDKVTKFRDGLPAVTPGVTQSTIRMQIDSVFNQAASFVQQMSYMKTSLQGMLDQAKGPAAVN